MILVRSLALSVLRTADPLCVSVDTHAAMMILGIILLSTLCGAMMNGRILRALTGIALAALLVLMPHASPLQAQSHSADFALHSASPDEAAQFAEGVIKGGLLGQITDRDIDEARAQFWGAWPDGPGFAEAEATFANLLWQKDFFYLLAFVVAPPPPGSFNNAPTLREMVSGRGDDLIRRDVNLGQVIQTFAGSIDEGIPAPLQGRFYTWVWSIRRALGAPNAQDLPNTLLLPAALIQPQPLAAYEDYKQARDLYELYTGPRSPLTTEDPRELLAAVYMWGRLLPPQEARAQVELLESIGGSRTVERVAEYFQRFGDDLRTVDPSRLSYALSTGPGSWLQTQKAEDPRSWLAGTFLALRFSDLSKVKAEIDSLMSRYGEDRVLAAADRLRHLEREPSRPALLRDYSGQPLKTDRWWLVHVLENPDVQLPAAEPALVEASNLDLLEQAADQRLSVSLLGTVTQARWKRTGTQMNDALHLQLKESDRVYLQIRWVAQDLLRQVTGLDGEKVIGQRLAASGAVARDGDRFYVHVRFPQDVRILEGGEQGVTTLPPSTTRLENRPEDHASDGERERAEAEQAAQEEHNLCEGEVFQIAEQAPKVVGGLDGLYRQVRYTPEARAAGVEGRVIVRFVVNPEGRAVGAEVLRGLGSGLDEEALRVVNEASFEPGQQRGKPVCVMMTLPIHFTL